VAQKGAPGSTVWITGASSGIGLALARLLARDGKHVTVSARSAEKLASIQQETRNIIAAPLDVTDRGAVLQTVSNIENQHGPIDIAVLNAGAWQLMPIEEFDHGAIRKGVDVNIMGVMHCLEAILPGMQARGQGHIAIVASVAGYRGLPFSIAYGPTKAALINLAETLRCELAPKGITVTLINPGFVDTPMTRENPFPMPGLISPEEAAEAIHAGLQQGRFEIAFPRGFTLAMKVLRLLPDRLFFWYVRRFIHRG